MPFDLDEDLKKHAVKGYTQVKHKRYVEKSFSDKEWKKRKNKRKIAKNSRKINYGLRKGRK